MKVMAYGAFLFTDPKPYFLNPYQSVPELATHKVAGLSAEPPAQQSTGSFRRSP